MEKRRLGNPLSKSCSLSRNFVRSYFFDLTSYIPGGVVTFRNLARNLDVFSRSMQRQKCDVLIFNSWVRASVPRVIAGTEICK